MSVREAMEGLEYASYRDEIARLRAQRDAADIARARRRKKHHETGRGTKRSGPKLKSRGFDRTLTKGFDGKVRRK